MSAILQSSDVLERLREIADLRTDLLGRGALFQPGDSVPIGFYLMVGALKRALCVCAGFTSAVQTRNVICTGAMLRMQIDTAVRSGAIQLVEDQDAFAHAVLFERRRISRLTDREGNRLTDRALVERFSERAPWLPDLYERTSGYVHFDGGQAFLTKLHADDATRTLYFIVSESDPHIPEALWMDAIESFTAVTRLFRDLLDEWIGSIKE